MMTKQERLENAQLSEIAYGAAYLAWQEAEALFQRGLIDWQIVAGLVGELDQAHALMREYQQMATQSA